MLIDLKEGSRTFGNFSCSISKNDVEKKENSCLRADIIGLLHFISIQGVDVEFQTFYERIEFHEISELIRVFQGFV